MITRIRINNYRSLVNFEIFPKKSSVFLGQNGSGKSNVLRAIRSLQDLVSRKLRIDDVFKFSDCNRNLLEPKQTFEIEVEEKNEKYEYFLEVEHYFPGKKAKILTERLTNAGNTLMEYSHGDASLHRDDGTFGTSYPFDWSLSLLGSIYPRKENRKLTWFQEFFRSIFVISLDPYQVLSETKEEQDLPDKFFTNFPSWYRFHSQDQGFAVELINELRDAVPGFDSFKFEIFGEETRKLKVIFRIGDRYLDFYFEELSEGQKALIILYSLIVFASRNGKTPATIFFDEPDNFLSLTEIQPWLNRLLELSSKNGFQFFLVSHHPEVMNYLMAKPVGFLFERSNDLFSKVRPLGLLKETSLSFSENFISGTLEDIK